MSKTTDTIKLPPKNQKPKKGKVRAEIKLTLLSNSKIQNKVF